MTPTWLRKIWLWFGCQGGRHRWTVMLVPHRDGDRYMPYWLQCLDCPATEQSKPESAHGKD
jgi:hypothetical protein